MNAAITARGSFSRPDATAPPISSARPLWRAFVHPDLPPIAPIFPRMTQHSRSITQGARKAGKAAPPPPAPRRISAKCRKAIDIMVKEATTQREAAKRAGMSEHGFCLALQKPHVKALVNQVKADFVQEVESMRAPFKAAALEHARHLMKNASSESVQARMVEFLGREEAKPAQINISNQVFSGGYEYVRPGQRVVTIEGEAHAPDDASSAQGDE